MKFIFTIILSALLLTSCTYDTIPLKGKYTDGNFEAYTEKPKDQVWDNIIEFFAKNGISIRIIDKSSGLIISNETSLKWSFEDKNGNLMDPKAWVIILKIIDPGTRKPIKPFKVTGEWNIRIKEQENKTLININLVNPAFMDVSYSRYGSNTEKTSTRFREGSFQSTGNFEKLIYEKIK